jgi:predicted nucleic-acid-binding protein
MAKITADTNLLVRVTVGDDAAQAQSAEEALQEAALIAITNVTLCELAWVLRGLYKRPAPKIASVIRGIVNSANVVTDRQAVDAGLAVLDAGGDFADGVIAHGGQALGGDKFLSFDRNAVDLLLQKGYPAELLS